MGPFTLTTLLTISALASTSSASFNLVKRKNSGGGPSCPDCPVSTSVVTAFQIEITTRTKTVHFTPAPVTITVQQTASPKTIVESAVPETITIEETPEPVTVTVPGAPQYLTITVPGSDCDYPTSTPSEPSATPSASASESKLHFFLDMNSSHCCQITNLAFRYSGKLRGREFHNPK